MVRGIPNSLVPTLRFPVTQSGKMSLPVDSSSFIYSHFEHVSGIIAPEGTQGVSISKLNLLDVLIRQINQIKKDAASPVQPASTEQMDSLIERYRNQIIQTRDASIAMPYIPSPGVQSGALFNIAI